MVQTTVMTVLCAAVVATYLIVPGMWQWTRAESIAARAFEWRAQLDTPSGQVDTKLVDMLRNASTSAQGSPLILTYHDISYDTASRWTVTPEAFAMQMQLLHDAGWTTLTEDDLLRWLDGEPLPPRSVVITFDDGTRGVWRYADRVLARNQQHALAFVITGFLGTRLPYYMTWAEVAALQASGRWDVEAHAHLGHVFIPVDAEGGQGPFLTSMKFLFDQHRFETPDEYRLRVLTDLTECKRQFSLHNLPEPKLFAYPFSAHSDVPGVDGVLGSIVRSLYKAAMLDQPETITATTTSNRAEGNIARMDVSRDVTLERFAEKLVAASPLDPGTAEPFRDVDGWTVPVGEPPYFKIDNDSRLTIDPGPGNDGSLQYARFRTSMWNTYIMSADVGGFSYSGDDTTTGLSVLTGDVEQEVDISIADGFYSIHVGFAGKVPVSSGGLPDRTSYHVVVVVTPAVVIVTIESQDPVVIFLEPATPRLSAGGIGVNCHREFDTSPPGVISNLRLH
jgi:biofilm PGA synthesis lipoprotein PgaB